MRKEESIYHLPSFSESKLANVIGVSAIWCMGDLPNPKFFFMPRKKSVGVFERQYGLPSGDIECPRGDRFESDSLMSFLEWEIAREFAEETGIADVSKEFDKYSIPLNEKKIGLKIPMKIIPLAFLRELYRGGKPQVFFLIMTDEMSEDEVERCFEKSSGPKEFSNWSIKPSDLSQEAICNYLYALEYLQHKDGEDLISLLL